MKELDIKQMWDNYKSHLDENLKLNKEILRETKRRKTNAIFNRIIPARVFAIIVGILWVMMVNFFIIMALNAGEYIVFTSLFIHSIVTTIAIGISLYHIILIYGMNGEDDIVEAQKKIANFRLTTLLGIRLSLLQIPVFSTFYISMNMISNAGTVWWVVQILQVSVFLALGIWCFNAFKLKNSHKKWFRRLVGDAEWNSLNKAESILQQIKEI